MKRQHLLLFCIGFLASLPWSADSAAAQSVSLTAPLSGQVFGAGDDYFTDELDQPANGNQRRMIGWEENFNGTSISSVNGLWQGTHSAADAYVFPVFPNISSLLPADSLPGDRTLPKLGVRHRINSSKYTRLAYRLNSSSRSAYSVIWNSVESPTTGLWPVPSSPVGASFDGFYHSDGANNHSGFFLYDFNLANLGSSFEVSQGSWSGNPFALRISPSTGAPAGTVTQIDWIRLVDPSSAPNITVSWNSSGLNSQYVITVFHDKNNSGYDGTPIKRFGYGADPGSYTFPSAILPPGSHYFYVEIQRHASGSWVGAPVRSGYSAATTIRHKPGVYVTAPSPASGDDYATVEVGNAWDMDPSGTDLLNLDPAVPQILRQFVNWSFVADGSMQAGGHRFQAQAEGPYTQIGNNESDVQLRLNVDSSNAIDPSHYRYVVTRMAHDPTNYPSISDKVRDGWVARFVAWNSNFMLDGMSTRAFITYENWHTYWFDMNDPANQDTGAPWSSFFRLPNFRFDPAEFTLPGVYTWTFLDYIKLVGENRADGSYDIKYTIYDNDSSNFTVRIYRDTDNTGFNGTLIATLNNQSKGNHTYTWNTSGLPDNTSYYIYLEVDDGVNVTRRYSQVHVKTGKYVPTKPDAQSGIRDWDYDGDGRSDQAVFRPAWGYWFLNKSLLGFSSFQWGDANFRPIRGDFDGDGITDLGMTWFAGPYYLHYVSYSGDGGFYARWWGLAGDQMVIGDYNGNGRDEIGIFRPSDATWWILNENDQVTLQAWGQPGDVPVPADYDGDGKDDMAIWRPADGMWWVLNSGFATGDTPQQITQQQWGLNGFVPVPGDWNTDGQADWTVWDPESGIWYIREKGSDAVSTLQWGFGFLGDIPLAGDFDGDGLLDATVYRGGFWFHNHRNGNITVLQHGLPGWDALPLKIGPFN